MPARLSVNNIIFYPQEYHESGRVVVQGLRAQQLRATHNLSLGLSSFAAVLGGRTGIARVVRIEAEEIEFFLQLTSEPLPREATTLIVAICRPQTVKKVLHLASSLGLMAVHFVRAENSVKSYLDSKAITESAIEAELILGLEQSRDSILPEVRVHHLFKPFIEDVLKPEISALNEQPKLLIADTRVAVSHALGGLPLSSTQQKVYCAIGPESGWNEFESSSFQSLGFEAISLGTRMLRVEHAAAVLSGQIMTLRQQAFRKW